ncbi:BnaAnng28040D [Brassica napus]|uniref:BnaAnng28040D protein n=1 Tax=Brassica napus TaxID=3708 RepID=A0A078JME7_BRANA|nr:BnaAnng28040D [Brassica napus]
MMNLSLSARKTAMPCLLEETQYIFPAGSPTLVELLKDCDTFINLAYSVTLRQRFGSSSTTGLTYLYSKGVTQLSKWDCLWITFACGLFFRILFYFTLLFGSKNKRT